MSKDNNVRELESSSGPCLRGWVLAALNTRASPSKILEMGDLISQKLASDNPGYWP